MYITRETDYGVRCVLYLARKAQEIAPVVMRLQRLCTFQKVFSKKILQRLVKAGIVISGRESVEVFPCKKPENIGYS